MTTGISRRTFLGAAAVPALAGASRRGGSQEVPRPKPAVSELAGYPLAELRDRYHRDLFDDYLPFVDRHVIDHERALSIGN